MKLGYLRFPKQSALAWSIVACCWLPFAANANQKTVTVLAQPKSQIAAIGSQVTFSVSCTGDNPVGYQWRFNDRDIAGANQNTLTLEKVQVADSGVYKVMLSDTNGVYESQPAVLCVNPGLPGTIPPPGGLVHWWTGDNSADDIQSGKIIGINGHVSFLPGKVGNAFNFEVPKAWLNLSNELAVTSADNWTIASWVLWRGLIANECPSQFIIYLGHSGFDGYGLYIPEIDDGQPNIGKHLGEVVALFGGVSFYFPAKKLQPYVWTHLALTRLNGLLTLYLNGTPVYTEFTKDPNPPPSDGGVLIGADGAPFNGMVDEIALFNRALSWGEVFSLYSVGSEGMCKRPEFKRVSIPNETVISLDVKGKTGFSIQIEWSLDLLDWKPLIKATNPTGVIQITDLISQGQTNQHRFYRATSN